MHIKMKLIILCLLTVIGLSHASESRKVYPANNKLKIFVLSGQSNMVGFGQLKGSPGTMETYVKNNPEDYGHLVDEKGSPVVRDDVWIVDLSYKDKQKQGWLTTGYGASEGHIGPEYAFGFAVGDYYEDPVLIIKSAWGGRSLSHNFLPPSSEEYPAPQKDGDKGFQYAEVVRHVKEITGNLKKYFPDYNGKGYEIIGFGWHQGWNDRINQQAVDAYEKNMVNFVNDIRKDLKVKDLPFVIANTGMGGWDIPEKAPYKKRVEKLMEAQLALADAEKYPQFKGSIAGVETRGFQRSQEESPSKQNFHWMRNWETYYLIGKSMGDSMVDLVSASSDKSPRIVNIINFIRQCEPRIDWITEDVLYDTVVEQIDILKKHNLKGTFLLQYDALIDARYQKLLKDLDPEQFEIGVWWEIPQPLVENSGYKWRGRYKWDWHADVAFATGYSPQERIKLVDTYMADFKKIFGYYPQSVASWFIDAHTLQYMYDKYNIVASANCKDQIGTDGYTLWGGYWNQGYYPSKKNAYMPAQNPENQIPVPIFRMLGSDPIHQYDEGLGTNRQRVISLEPVYTGGGGDPDWCKWYFDEFVDGAAMAYAYVQVGQENSFTWQRMKEGYEIQIPMVARMIKNGQVTVKTLGETGKWFKDNYKVTPPTSVTALKDHSEKDLKTVWFNSRFYRVNLLWEKGTLRFRDIHIFDETVESDYFTKRGTSSQSFYYALPVVDGFNWSSKENVAGLNFKTHLGNDITGTSPTVDDSVAGQLTVKWPTVSPKGEIVIKFDEKKMSISAHGDLDDGWRLGLTGDKSKADLPFLKTDGEKLSCSFRGSSYDIIAAKGSFNLKSVWGLNVSPEDGRISMDFSKR